MIKAEERALEAYPITMVRRRYDGIARSDDPYDSNLHDRYCFQKGYEQAEKDLSWHSVDESLPPIDEEVIVLTDNIHGKTVKGATWICFGHRPNPNGYVGRNIDTEEVKEYEVQTYNGWNIPGVRYWMPCPKIPNED